MFLRPRRVILAVRGEPFVDVTLTLTSCFVPLIFTVCLCRVLLCFLPDCQLFASPCFLIVFAVDVLLNKLVKLLLGASYQVV